MARSSDVTRIQYSSIQFLDTKKMTFILNPIKNSLKPVADFVEQFEDTSICPVIHCKHIYNEQVTLLEQQQVFVVLTQPFAGLSSQAIAKDILMVLQLAGIDAQRFKVHSTHHAAAFKALDNGARVDSGRWKSFSTFEKFYNRSSI